MNVVRKPRIAIIGMGPAGLFAALLLSRFDLFVDVYEKVLTSTDAIALTNSPEFVPDALIVEYLKVLEVAAVELTEKLSNLRAEML